MTFDPVELFDKSPFHRWLGCEVVRMDAEEVVLRLPFRDEFVGDPDHPGYHGGVLGALIDVAGTFAVIAVAEQDCITVDYRVDFLRPAVPGPLVARAHSVKTGRTLGVAEAHVNDEDGNTVAVGRVSLYILRPTS